MLQLTKLSVLFRVHHTHTACPASGKGSKVVNCAILRFTKGLLERKSDPTHKRSGSNGIHCGRTAVIHPVHGYNHMRYDFAGQDPGHCNKPSRCSSKLVVFHLTVVDILHGFKRM